MLITYASEVYRQTINNLCPNTYYEFFGMGTQYLAKTCGADSSGAQFARNAYCAVQTDILACYPT